MHDIKIGSWNQEEWIVPWVRRKIASPVELYCYVYIECTILQSFYTCCFIDTCLNSCENQNILEMIPQIPPNEVAMYDCTVADPEGVPRGPCPPPSPVQTSHKKDGRQRWPHRFHVSWPPLPGRWIRCCQTSFVMIWSTCRISNITQSLEHAARIYISRYIHYIGVYKRHLKWSHAIQISVFYAVAMSVKYLAQIFTLYNDSMYGNLPPYLVTCSFILLSTCLLTPDPSLGKSQLCI